ncbi:MAG: AI-2E family transporter [Bacteroidetes bacterium]|nr:AI-2E family transporter [Bacteroidota bacterium]
MTKNWSNNSIIKSTILILITLAVVFGVVWLLLQITTILFYFIIAAIISIVGKPICDFIQKLKIGKFKTPDSLAALFTIIILFGALFGIVKIFTPLVVEQTNNISHIDTERVAESLQNQIVMLDSMIIQFQDPEAPAQSVEQVINENLRNWINVTSITHIFNNIMGGLGNILVALFSITLSPSFFLRDDKLFYNIVMTLTPTKFEANGVFYTRVKYI